MVDFRDDRHLDVLQNLEAAGVDVYRFEPEVLDSEIDRASGAVIAALNAMRLEKPFDPEKVNMGERVMPGTSTLLTIRLPLELGGGRGHTGSRRDFPGSGSLSKWL